MNTEFPRPTTPRLTMLAAALLGLVSAAALTTGCASRSDSSGGSYAPSSSRAGAGPADASESAAPGGSLGTKSFDRDAAGFAEDEAVAQSPSFDGDAFEEAPAQRSKPGLGTEYGEHRWSQVRSVSFRRGSPRSPDVVLSMRYNDLEGLRDLARVRGSAFQADAVSEAGPFRMTLMDGAGRSLQGAMIGGESYAVGEAGQRYIIGIENDSGERYEVLATVDGLDVIDGEHGSFDKRGYVIEPFTSFVIEGWRTSEQSVAAFRFSSIEESYAERTGRGRNIGVIGAAFFHERARPDFFERRRDHAFERRREVERRDHADPFPGR